MSVRTSSLEGQATGLIGSGAEAGSELRPVVYLSLTRCVALYNRGMTNKSEVGGSHQGAVQHDNCSALDGSDHLL